MLLYKGGEGLINIMNFSKHIIDLNKNNQMYFYEYKKLYLIYSSLKFPI